jgi:flavin reductase (DIM6/NTAB) family NADH-FMN oxidoreductase RutF
VTSAPLTAGTGTGNPGGTTYGEAVVAAYSEQAAYAHDSAAERNAPEPGGFHRFMRMWATGIAVVTGQSATLPVGCTVTALTSVSLDPPLLLVSLDRRSRTLAALRTQRRFGLNLLAAHQSRLAVRFATASDDRFGGVPHRIIGNVPILDGALAAAVCRVERTIAVADHVLVLGLPGWYCGSEGGRDRPPLIRFDGASRPLREEEP